MAIAFLRFSIHKRFHGTATPGTREAQAASSVFATQERSAAGCRHAVDSSQAIGTERIRGVGVTNCSLTPRFGESVSRKDRSRNRFSGYTP